MSKDSKVSVLTVKMNEDQFSMLNLLVAENGKETGDFSKYRYLLTLLEKEYKQFTTQLQTA